MITANYNCSLCFSCCIAVGIRIYLMPGSPSVMDSWMVKKKKTSFRYLSALRLLPGNADKKQCEL